VPEFCRQNYALLNFATVGECVAFIRQHDLDP
jgi:hypothetical protein